MDLIYFRNCKRCKDNEAEKGSLNCVKCNERNSIHTAKLISQNKAKKLHSKSSSYASHGGLGNEWEKGVAGHLENL